MCSLSKPILLGPLGIFLCLGAHIYTPVLLNHLLVEAQVEILQFSDEALREHLLYPLIQPFIQSCGCKVEEGWWGLEKRRTIKGSTSLIYRSIG